MDERRLLARLRDVERPCTPHTLQLLTSLVVLACYDRQVERDFFTDVLELCNDLAGETAAMDRAVTLGRAVTVLDKRQQLADTAPGPDNPDAPAKQRLPDLLYARFHDHHAVFTTKRLALADLVELLMQCPDLDDPVS